MDPVGSWSAYHAASYNRLAGSAASSGDYPHHLAATNTCPSPSTTSPLLLQAAHATSSPVFTPGSFLSPPPVGYDPVFSPFLHHANQKAHYTQALTVAQHRQAIASSKQGATETDSLRESYTPVHPQPLPPPNAAFFEQASGSVQPSTIAWTHQGSSHSQLPSPFGILPHESVVGSGPTGPATKHPYENFNPAHFAAAQTLSHINSHLVAVSYSDASKRLTPRPVQSPPSKIITPSVTSSGYYQQSSPSSSNQFLVTKTQTSTTKVYSGITGSVQQTQAHNMMSSSTTSSSKDYSVPLPQVHSSSPAFSSRIPEKQSGEFQSPTTKNNPPVPSKIAERRDSGHESTQSSPISFAVMESNQNRSTSKVPLSRTGIPQQSQLQQQLLSHQKTGSFRGFSSSTGSTPESEYNQGSGGRNTASTDAGYSSGSSVGHSGMDASLQRSPLDSHVTSPTAYPAYHSPMTSMSSPSPVQQHVDQNVSYKQNPSPQVTPTSPLDASLSRHPSVITRGDPNYPNDHFPQKQCWEAPEQLRSQNYSSYSSDVPQNTSSIQMQHQRTSLMAAERHQGYLESTNQNVKGDPMTIVKNLQNLQQQCQAPPVSADIKLDFENPKPVSKSSGSLAKKKKSIDNKVLVAHPDSLSKFPPPAHLNQPQLGSGYVEYDKWNVQHSQKSVNGNSTFVAQNTSHSNLNPMDPAFVPHSVNPPTGQTHYLQSHNLPNSHDPKYLNPEMEKDSGAVTDPAQANANVSLPKVEDMPIAKVIVPDVEEELGFLAEVPKTDSDRILISKTLPIKLCPNPKSSFMESFIKFIEGNGKKESSPPPRQKPVKPTYIPMNKRTQAEKREENKQKKKSSSPPPSQTGPPPSQTEPPPSQTEPIEDDPRYFPLPKDPSSRKLNSSDSEETDYDNLIPTITHRPSSNNASEDATDNEKHKRRTSKRKNKPTQSRQSKKRKRSASEESLDLPRRKSSRRKAKEKISSFEDKTDDLFSGLSGSDNAWSPDEDSDDDDGYGRAFGSGKRRKSKGNPPPSSRFLESSDEEKSSKRKGEVVDVSGICPVCANNFADDPTDAVKCTSCKKQFHCSCCSLQTMQRLQKLGSRRGSWRCDSCKSEPAKNNQNNSSRKNGQSRRGRRVVRNTKVNSQEKDELDSTLGTEEYFPFKSGEFIIVKEELAEEHPAIWRVDGKTLLQKYEPFDQNGEKLYRNISTYSGWTPQNRDIYQKIPVQFIVQGRTETIVRFLRSEMVDPAVELAYLEHSLLGTARYQDNFEVYIQTLISQALDANFLTEIFSEKDEYFLENVEVIDRVTEERRVRLVAAVDWPVDTALQRGVTTWPCYNVLADLKAGPTRLCEACERSKVHARILLYGQPYNPNTLDGSKPDSSLKDNKDFMICLECIKYVQLYNKLVHQKYIMYIECAKRVQDKRRTEPQKDTTVILNELLADEEWLNKLFRQVRTVWADVEKAEREKKKRLGLPIEPPSSTLTQLQKECNSANVDTEEQGNDEDDVIVEKELLVREIKVEKDSDVEEGENFDVKDNDEMNDVTVAVVEDNDDMNDVTVAVVEDNDDMNDVTVAVVEDNDEMNDVTLAVVEEGSTQQAVDVAEPDKPEAIDEVSIERVPCEFND